MRLVCLALVLAVRLLPAADAPLAEFLPAGTKALIGIRLRTIVESPLFQGLATQTVTAGSDWMSVAAMIGFDPLKDIDELLLASPADGKNAPALLVVRGRFDVERLSAHARRYHGIALLSNTKSSESLIALLDSSTALAGDPAMVRAAIDGRGHSATLSGPLAQHAATLRERYDIWGIGQVPQGASGKVPQAPPGLDSLDRFEFGLTLSHGIDASAELHARSAKDLEKLTASLQFFRMAMAAQTGQSGSAVQLDTHVEGNTLKLALKVPEEEVRKAMQARSAALRPGYSGRSMTITSPGAVPSVPSGAAPARPQVNANGDTVVLTLPGKR